MKSKTILWLLLGLFLFVIILGVFGSSSGALIGLALGIAQIGGFVGIIWYFIAREREKREAKGEKPKKYSSFWNAVMDKEDKKK